MKISKQEILNVLHYATASLAEEQNKKPITPLRSRSYDFGYYDGLKDLEGALLKYLTHSEEHE